jgi:cytochrome b
MKRILVWDLSVRLLHWALAGSVGAAMAIGFLADDDSPLFRLHMLFGVVAVFIVVLRLVWGLVGDRHARLVNFPLHPREVLGYAKDVIFKKTRRYAGNNPGSALAAVLMFLLVPALMISGGAFGRGEAEELHESLAWALLAVVVLHLSGLAWHTIRHRENIATAMITGTKPGDPADALPSARPLPALVLLLAGGAWISALFANNTPGNANLRLPLTSTSIRLGESGNEDHGKTKHTRREHREEHDDDD